MASLEGTAPAHLADQPLALLRSSSSRPAAWPRWCAPLPARSGTAVARQVVTALAPVVGEDAPALGLVSYAGDGSSYDTCMAPSGGVEHEYQQMLPRLERLEVEGCFTVEHSLKAANIKIHSVTSRVKDLGSTKQKLGRLDSDHNTLGKLTDLVGLRIVVLFLTDLPRVRDLLYSSFEVVYEDDKISGTESENAFGYMSHHFLVRLPASSSGPRYDDLKGITFEIQVRTILMDAWANVSHYLDYKGESSIPEDLRRDFYALSGLFYVADKHFEIFYESSIVSQQAAADSVVGASDLESVSLNLDTLEALLRKRYPDREQSPRIDLSSVVEELASYDYSTIEQVEKLLDKNREWFIEDERTSPPSPTEGDPDATIPYATSGVVRRSLQNEVGYERWSEDHGFKSVFAALLDEDKNSGEDGQS
jgi:putative GTP pyrophosphokinase